MDEVIQRAMREDRLVDITTIGRKTGRAHRIEIALHYLDGRLFISGRPGLRHWYANLLARPDLTIHLKQSVQQDIPARATPITDSAARLEVFSRMRAVGERMGHVNVEEWVGSSPLVELELTD